MMNVAPFNTVELYPSHTLAVIKPDAYAKKYTGAIIHRILENGLGIVGALVAHWPRIYAERFYAAHAGKPYFNDLAAFMSSGPSLTLLLSLENSATDEDAVNKWRALMGATDPKKAVAGTMRGDFGAQEPEAPMMHNATHGSDSPAAVLRELDVLASLRELSFSRNCFSRSWRMRAEDALAQQ